MKTFRTGTIVLILFSLAIGGNASGQKLWTLEQCIQQAKMSNIQIQRHDLQVTGAKNDLLRARASVLPDLRGWLGHSLSAGKTVNLEDYSYINTQYQSGNMGLTTGINLFEGLQKHHNIRASKFLLQANNEQSAALANDITILVVAGYLDVLLAEELVEVAREKVTVTEDQIAQAEAFFDEGRIAKVEVLELKSQKAQDVLQLTQAGGNLESAMLNLKQILNIDVTEEIQLQKPTTSDFLVPEIPSSQQVFEHAVNQQPRMKSVMLQQRALEAALNSSRGLALPVLGISGTYYSRYSALGINPREPGAPYPYGEQLKDNNYKQASIQLNIPIFNGLATHNAISRSKLNVMDAKLAVEQEKKDLHVEIQQAYTLARNALANYIASGDAVQSIQESNDLVKEQYAEGLATAIDLKLSGSQLIQATSNLLQSKYEMLLRSKVLDFYLDKQISF